MRIKEIFDLLPPAHRRKSGWILAVILFRSLLDFIGMAALLSVLYLLLNNTKLHAYLWAAIIGGGIFMFIKNISAIVIDRRCTDWFLSLYRYYSSKLLKSYYREGLLFIRSKGSTALSYEINSICFAFVMNVLMPAFQITGRFALLLLFCIALIIYSPAATLLFLSFIILAAWVYLGVVRNRVSIYGKAENRAKNEQWRIVRELFHGYAEIETNQAFGLLNDRFKKGMENISYYRKQIETIQRIPAALIETCMTLALIIVVFTVHDNSELVILLGIFSIAGLRILPSIRFIISGWIQIRNNLYTAEIISKAPFCKRDDKADISRNSLFFEELTTERISFGYVPDEAPVLHNFSMTVKRGEHIGIQGISGIGKSTLFNLLLGFLSPQSGEIRINGVPLTNIGLKEWHRTVGYVPQEVFIIDGTIAENIALGTKEKEIDQDRLLAVLEQVQMDEWLQEQPEGTATLLGENGCRISGGQKQRIGIARTLYKGATILFFDEATSALDEKTEQEILEIIQNLSGRKNHLTLLMIAHRESSLSRCDRIIKIGH